MIEWSGAGSGYKGYRQVMHYVAHGYHPVRDSDATIERVGPRITIDHKSEIILQPRSSYNYMSGSGESFRMCIYSKYVKIWMQQHFVSPIVLNQYPKHKYNVHVLLLSKSVHLK